MDVPVAPLAFTLSVRLEATQFFKQAGFHTVTVHQPTLTFNSTIQTDTSNLDQQDHLGDLVWLVHSQWQKPINPSNNLSPHKKTAMKCCFFIFKFQLTHELQATSVQRFDAQQSEVIALQVQNCHV